MAKVDFRSDEEMILAYYNFSDECDNLNDIKEFTEKMNKLTGKNRTHGLLI
ncbi:MAG: hypothetical protein PHW32_01140 [Bacilli bacterium]|nr:hypothetical protein [Bacilli bacterium]MDD4282908.1 hypothetical protein [Bacilli bacterium]MDD4719104.1 hypothetical protein [Bacilli bacterium]